MQIKQLALMLSAAALTTLSFAAPSKSSPPLLTEDQQHIDKVALSLLGDPAVKAAREAGIKLWSGLRAGQLDDGKAQLKGAVDEAVYFSLRSVAANDPSRPRVIWTEAPSYSSGKSKVPGSRIGGDNPDRIYRTFAADPAYRYEIRGHRNALPSQEEFSFEAIPTVGPLGQPKFSLSSKDIDVAQDGSFTITVDATPANGRRNHLYLPQGTATVLVRDTLIDWAKELPNQLVIKRLDGPEAPARTPEVLSRLAAEEVTKSIEANVKFIDWAWKTPVNEIKPQVRKLEDGVPGAVAALSRFRLKNDEALVITIQPDSAKYVGLQVTDPWLRSVPYWNSISSLNNLQARQNADGSLTYVLSSKDPGYSNWLSTGGLRDGILVLRVESSPQPAVPEKIVRETRVLKLSQLATALPKEATRVSASERAQLLAKRSAEFAKRTIQ